MFYQKLHFLENYLYFCSLVLFFLLICYGIFKVRLLIISHPIYYQSFPQLPVCFIWFLKFNFFVVVVCSKNHRSSLSTLFLALMFRNILFIVHLHLCLLLFISIS